jgi:cell wall-associated NlpC family hydrolase
VRYGEPVVIVHRIGAWTRVRVPDQTGGHYPHGIIGWIASRQLAREPAGWDSATSVATVTATRTTLHSTVGGRQRSLGLSYATTLPVISTGTNAVEVGVPGPAQSGWLPRSAVRVHAPDSPALTPSAHQVIAQARRFLGLPYLWAGMSAWGFDCSGLTDTVFSMMGITLPRDAADQSRVGRWVPRRQLRPGDLVFFSSSRSRWAIHHVAIYAGHGRVLQSPYTGARVQLTKLWRGYLKREYWGATRPLS